MLAHRYSSLDNLAGWTTDFDAPRKKRGYLYSSAESMVSHSRFFKMYPQGHLVADSPDPGALGWSPGI